jgi:hypothetical protein
VTDSSTVSYAGEDPKPRLPDLDLLRCVGRGAYGEVWLATNRTTGKLLAVKVVRLQSADAAGRAAREIQALVRFEGTLSTPHENLLTIHHVGQTDELLFYTMDPADDVRGGVASADPTYQPATLAARMACGQLSPEECLLHAEQLVAGLAHLHSAGLVHRDVKPSNCLFAGGRLKVADFGLVTQADGTASMVGTPKYMPPDGRMDARADVYAAGLTIYEMFTGLPAESFPRWSAEAIRARQHPILLALNRLVLRACQPDPRRRFQDAREMLDAPTELKAHARARRRRPVKLLAGVAACLVATASLAVALLQGPARRVDVSFITTPFEAEIYLDGNRLADSQGMPYKTPCTVPDLPARVHHVVFRKAGYPDLAAGSVDFAQEREVQREWPSEAQDR